ncbi:DUF1289 domain-containing protein [Pseudomonas borbori]|uniref:DUF1289 domain-containing protein n=1 Tax=Pseudomonas borbori TaxID=289003 RepID=UPI000B8382E7|nr:DUF1289 domain-containing protein [Pseudomonas borbori]
MSCWGKCSRASPWSNLEPVLSSKSSDSAPERVGAVLASPCVRRCCLDDGDMCLGCGRLLGEILEWSDADDARRRIICHCARIRLQQYRS